MRGIAGILPFPGSRRAGARGRSEGQLRFSGARNQTRALQPIGTFPDPPPRAGYACRSTGPAFRLAAVKPVFAQLLRWAYLMLVAVCLAYLGLHFIRQTGWYRERLYHVLLTGNTNQQLHAASTLAQLEAQEPLLRALKAAPPAVHDLARRALEHIWFNAAGHKAYQLTQSAYQAAEQENFPEALALLDRLLRQHPDFAEGWNRRASVHWQMGEWRKSIDDCERTLALNPNHYGAWQGLGICQLQLGDVAEACRSLRAALKIAPHDEVTRRSLQKCEDLLRMYPNPLIPSQRALEWL